MLLVASSQLFRRRGEREKTRRDTIHRCQSNLPLRQESTQWLQLFLSCASSHITYDDEGYPHGLTGSKLSKEEYEFSQTKALTGFDSDSGMTMLRIGSMTLLAGLPRWRSIVSINGISQTGWPPAILTARHGATGDSESSGGISRYA